MGVSGRHPPGVTGSVPRGDTLKLTSCVTHLRPHLSLVRACSARPFLRRSSHPTLPSFPEGRTQALLPTDLVKTERMRKKGTVSFICIGGICYPKQRQS